MPQETFERWKTENRPEYFPEDSVIVDKNGIIISVSSPNGHVFGPNAHSLIGEHIEVLMPREKSTADSSLEGMQDQPENQPDTSRDDDNDLFVLTPMKDISELTKNASNLKEMELQYRIVSEFTYCFEYWQSPDGPFKYVSPSVKRFTGYDAAEFIDNPQLLDSLILPEYRDAFRHHDTIPEDKSGYHELQLKIRRKNGDVIWLEHICQPVTDENGANLGVRASNRDITAHKQAEEANTRKKELNQAIVESLTEGIVVHNADGRIISSNPRAEKILGLTKEQISGKTSLSPDWNAIHQDGTPFLGETHPAVITLNTGEAHLGVPMGVNKPDGSLTWITINAVPLKKMDSDKPYAVVASFEDVTKNVLTRLQLEKQLQWMTIRNSVVGEITKRNDFTNICTMILNRIHECLEFDFGVACVYDTAESKLCAVSQFPPVHPVFTELGITEKSEIPFDYTLLTDLKPNSVNILPLTSLPTIFSGLIHQQHLKALSKHEITLLAVFPIAVNEIVEGALILAYNQRTGFDEYERNFLDGVAGSMSVAKMKDGLYEELMQSYRKLKSAQSKMLEQERMNAMGLMASGIAHDINNTLAPITLYTEALIDTEDSLSDRARRFLKSIQDAGKDIESTINRLRSFYRKPTEGEVFWQTIDIARLFSQLCEMTRPRWQDLAQKNGITIELKIDIPEHSPTIDGVESEIREALINLIFNAVDAMGSGGIITLRAIENDQTKIIEIEDSGTGMTEEQKQKCLVPFYTTKGQQGTGLGLSSVFGTMERHQGTVEIESDEGRGTTVRMIFPIRKSTEKEKFSQAPPSTLRSLRILCIDDDPKVRDGLREILEINGHVPVVSESGKQGIEAMRESMEEKKAFDVVITDLGMPDMDGWETAEKIKTITPETPVILLSGWGNLLVGDENASKYVDAVLGKPPRMSELRETLRTLFPNRSEGTDNDER